MNDELLVRKCFTEHLALRIIACLTGLATFVWAPSARAYYSVQYTSPNDTAGTGLHDDNICNLTEAIYSISNWADSYGCHDTFQQGQAHHPDPDLCDQGVRCGQIYLDTTWQESPPAPPVYTVSTTQTINANVDVLISAGDGPGDSFIESPDSSVFTISAASGGLPPGRLYISGGTVRHGGTGNGRVITNYGYLNSSAAGFGDGIVTGTFASGTITGCGGAIYNEYYVSLGTGSIVYHSAATRGGGIYNKGILYLWYSTIGGERYYTDGASGSPRGNTATDGGGIFNDAAATSAGFGFGLEPTGITIAFNTASGNGGGVYSQERVFVSSSTIAFNKAANGGGFYTATNLQALSNYLELYNSTVAYNQATACSGTLCGSTGGGVLNVVGSRSDGCLFANNTRTNGASDYNGAPHTEGGQLAFFTSKTNTTGAQSDPTGNPNLATALADGGYYTKLLTIPANSLARDPTPVLPGGTDQTGWTRDSNPDYGAYEYR